MDNRAVEIAQRLPRRTEQAVGDGLIGTQDEGAPALRRRLLHPPGARHQQAKIAVERRVCLIDRRGTHQERHR